MKPHRSRGVQIDVAPLGYTAAIRRWAVVTVTNNETQRVTVITPQ